MFNNKLKKEVEDLKSRLFGPEKKIGIDSIWGNYFRTVSTLESRIEELEDKHTKLLSYLKIEYFKEEKKAEGFRKIKKK